MDDVSGTADLDGVWLGKWPRLIVVGQPVTEEQANEILVRTDDWYLTGNDRHWTRLVAGVAGIELDEHGWTRFAPVREFRRSVGVLDLQYLGNDQIISSWIGGPHGWCDWNGAIGCANYNIGKHPSAAEVLDDWRTIATAFPYLDLTSQLVAEEGEADRPAVEFRVSGGRVEVDAAPDKFVGSPVDIDTAAVVGRLLLVGGERGVNLIRLRDAVNQVRTGAGTGDPGDDDV